MIALLHFTFSLLLSLIINIDFNEAAEGGTDNEHIAAIWKRKNISSECSKVPAKLYSRDLRKSRWTRISSTRIYRIFELARH